MQVEAQAITSVHVIAEGLGSAEEDALVGQLPQLLPVQPLAAASQLLNGSLQANHSARKLVVMHVDKAGAAGWISGGRQGMKRRHTCICELQQMHNCTLYMNCRAQQRVLWTTGSPLTRP